MTDIQIPQHTKDALDRYIINGLAPGSFLEAVLTNDFMGAVGRADHINVNYLKEIAQYVWNVLPSNSWGSEEAVKNWLENHDQQESAIEYYKSNTNHHETV